MDNITKGMKGDEEERGGMEWRKEWCKSLTSKGINRV
jgi:hypothetical protein